MQVLIPSRSINKQLGERSQVKCSPGDDINGKLLKKKYTTSLNIWWQVTCIMHCKPEHAIQLKIYSLHCFTAVDKYFSES